MYIGGIQILSDAGATWTIAPQLGDLSHVDAGFSTSRGLFSSKWSVDGSTLRLQISVPKGTTGSVGIPFPANHTAATLIGGSMRGEAVQADASGRFWMDALPGGDFDFVLVGV